MRGFSASDLWRLRQFSEAYADAPDLAPMVRDLPWSHSLLIIGGCKRQIRGVLFECVATSKRSMSSALVHGHPLCASSFKDSYLLDFLSLGDGHREAGPQHGLAQNLKSFCLSSAVTSTSTSYFSTETSGSGLP